MAEKEEGWAIQDLNQRLLLCVKSRKLWWLPVWGGLGELIQFLLEDGDSCGA